MASPHIRLASFRFITFFVFISLNYVVAYTDARTHKPCECDRLERYTD